MIMRQWQRQHPRANEFIVIIALAALILVVGWRVMLLVSTAGGPGGAGGDKSGGAPAPDGADFLVYGTSTVVDRGSKDWAKA